MHALPLKSETVSFDLRRLQTGVDNIRHDVYLSPGLVQATRQLMIHLLARHTRSHEVLSLDWGASVRKQQEHFKRACGRVLQDAVHRAKLEKEPQIDRLAIAAVIKFILLEADRQFETLIARYRAAIRGLEAGRPSDASADLRRRMGAIAQNERRIRFRIRKEILDLLGEVHRKEIREIRRVTFGESAAVPDHYLNHPFLWEPRPDDVFTLESYEILLAHRLEDPDTYDAILDRMRRLLRELAEDAARNDSAGEAPIPPDDPLLDAWLMAAENVEVLFNCFQTRFRIKELRRGGKKRRGKGAAGPPPPEPAAELRSRERAQRRRLQRAYAMFQRSGLLGRIISMYEIQPVFRDYCPPLVPQLLHQYMVSFRTRRTLSARLRRLRKFYGKSLSLRPLKRRRRRVRWMARRNRMAYLLRFMKDFSRYHRDRRNFQDLRNAMDSIHLVREEETRKLSGANHTLYEFLLPKERNRHETPIVGHVILKADVRGSTDLAFRMKRKGLNPASYFSLNFFEPISRILEEYGAGKVFVEGDAIILSLFEHRDQPENWYAVSRACGLAVRILFIVQHYNGRNREHGLPGIELGIGVSYSNGRPTFLFDGDHRIMISSAINRADRLAGCARSLRRRFSGKKRPFNLYVYQSGSNAELSETTDDLNLRYNVNGIELNARGFRKLREEIELKRFGLVVKGERLTFYTGRFPLATGEYRRLVVREGVISRVQPQSLDVVGATDRRYYEICTHPKVYELLKQHMRDLERARRAGPLRMI
jgi:hypothetical protein